MIVVEYRVTSAPIIPERLNTIEYIAIEPSRNGANMTRSRVSPVVYAMDHKSVQTSFVSRSKTIEITQDAIHDSYMNIWDEFIESVQDNQTVVVYAQTEPLVGGVWQAHYLDDSEVAAEFACKRSTRSANFKILSDHNPIDYILPTSVAANSRGWSDYSGENAYHSVSASFDNINQVSTRIFFSYVNFSTTPLGVFVNGRRIGSARQALTEASFPYDTANFDIPQSSLQAGTNVITVAQMDIGSDWGVKYLRHSKIF